jgi:hypothetical protein
MIFRQTIEGTTVGTASTTVSTTYAPATGNVARVAVEYSIKDVSAQTSHGGTIYCVVNNFVGPAIPDGQVQAGVTTDPSLGSATPSAAIVDDLLAFTLTPPSPFTDTLQWSLTVTAYEN